jgi:hypothetical protein
LSITTSTICGITSPARWTITVSPTRMSRPRGSAAVIADALDVILVVQRGVGPTTPPTVTGASRATGVSAPVRPTWMSMPFSTVVACSAGNLCAIAQRGERETKPSRSCQIEPVDLVDDAVDVVAELGALASIIAIEGQQFLDAIAQRRQRVGRQSPRPSAIHFDHAELRLAGISLISPQA